MDRAGPGVPAPPTRAARDAAALLAVGAGFAVLIAVGLTTLSGGRAAPQLGLPDPGPVTTFGLPAVRALSEVGMVAAIGGLLLATFLVPPRRTGDLDDVGYRGLRLASYASAAWAMAALAAVPLTVADTFGRPVADVLDIAVLAELVPRVPTAAAWAVTGLAALVVHLGSRAVSTWRPAVVVFGVAVFGPLPVAVTGHSGSGGSHDLATDSLVLHLLAAALWVGGLGAILALAAGRDRERAAALAVAVPRFSRLALICWVVLAVSGVVNAVVRLPTTELLTSTYGLLVLGKVAALVGLGLFGAAHRKRTVGPAARGDAGPLLRLAALEVLLMLATIGLAVGLSRTPPPAFATGPPSPVAELIGYDLAGPPTFARLTLDWRFDLLLGTCAIVVATLYLLGVRRLRRQGDRWPVGRSVAWIGGCAALLAATSSGIGRYAAAVFSLHMAQQMVLAILVPVLLVIGAPVTLALRALPRAGDDEAPGPREWLLSAVHSPALRLLTNPLVSLPLFVGCYYLLYFSDLFAWALPEHWAHVVMDVCFVAVGLLFFWPLIGVDHAPHRLGATARLGVLFTAVSLHALFGLLLVSTNTILGDAFYPSLALPWIPDPLLDQKIGGGVAWALGELPLLIVVIAVLARWARHEE